MIDSGRLQLKSICEQKAALSMSPNSESIFESLIFIMECLAYELNVERPANQTDLMTASKVIPSLGLDDNPTLDMLASPRRVGSEMSHKLLSSDVDRWSKVHSTVMSCAEADYKASKIVYSSKSIFEKLKVERSEIFDLKNHRTVFKSWMARIGQTANNPVIDACFGTIIVELHCCSCGHNVYYYQCLAGIEADVGFFLSKTQIRAVSLAEVIGHCFDADLESDRFCFNCQLRRIYRRRPMLYKPPETLFLSLYADPCARRLDLIMEDSDLDLSSLVFSSYTGKVIYGLRAVITKNDPDLRSPRSHDQARMPETKFSEASIYCDEQRKWRRLTRQGLEDCQLMELASGTNRLSFCLFDLA